MKYTKTETVDYDVKYVSIRIPTDRFDEDELPADIPFRLAESWLITVDIETGEIQGWPRGQDFSYDLYLKVVDTGSYRLLDENFQTIDKIIENYVPHCVVPGDYCDYIELKINDDGFITNWEKPTHFDDFN